jgi:hypothetical protein
MLRPLLLLLTQNADPKQAEAIATGIGDAD